MQPVRTTPRCRRLAVAVLLLALVCGGCLKGRQDVVVEGDGSGTMRLHLEINEKAFAAVAASFPDFGDLGAGSTTTAAPPSSLPPMLRLGEQALDGGVRVSAARRGDILVADVSFPFRDAADFEAKMRQVDAALSTDGTSTDAASGRITIQRRGDLIDIALVEDEDGSDGEIDFDPSALEGVLDEDAQPEYVVTITGPGRVVTSNADSVDGRTARWDLMRTGAPSTLTMTARVEGPLRQLLWPAVGAALLLLLVAGAAIVLARTRVRTTPVSGDPTVLGGG